MSIRKYASGSEKQEKKSKRQDELIESQKWAMNKFLTRNTSLDEVDINIIIDDFVKC
jgi:hypothetical protein